MNERIRREPALVVGLVQAILALVVAFGLDLSGEQTAAILAVTAAVLAFVVRSQVTPTQGPTHRLDERGHVNDYAVAVAFAALVGFLLAALVTILR